MIIGVTGPIGAGKTTIADLLKEKGFEKTSLSDSLRDELNRRDVAINRDNLRNTGDELREEFGKGVLAEKALEKIGNSDDNWVIESVRLPQEAQAIQEKGIMIGVTAPDKVRFERTAIRKRDQEEASMDFDAFVKKDLHDRGVGIDEALEICDYLLDNDGTLDDLKARLEEILEKLKK